MSTSLKRAVKREEVQRKGAFEACFAQGLDLSEFVGGEPKKAESSNTSAAAALLQVKVKESQKRQQQEEEDARMEESVKERAQNLKSSMKNNDNRKVMAAALRERPTATDCFKTVDTLLVKMHQGDDKLSTKNQSKTRMGMKYKTRFSRANSAKRLSNRSQKQPMKNRTVAKSKKLSKFGK